MVQRALTGPAASCREVPTPTQKGLTNLLKQAALNMSSQERSRLQLGPPPLVGFAGVLPLPATLVPHPLLLLAPHSPDAGSHLAAASAVRLRASQRPANAVLPAWCSERV